MPEPSLSENDFLIQLDAAVDGGIADEQFGVTELADKLNMSRSNLLRKVKKSTGLSVSQLISQARLKRAMELLQTSAFNVSEVSHRTGFASTSYFIKCFREFYGYPPGEVGKRNAAGGNEAPLVVGAAPSNRKALWLGTAALAVAIAICAAIYYALFFLPPPESEKSIAVLAFKNESNDSTNVYLIDGLMESTLNNLQKIRDLKVISRTSSEKYRNARKSIPEMARELNARYFVEGSGQKIGDKILLNIQLIEGSSDRHLWAKQYRRDASDIFGLQSEVAKDIAFEIQAIITPEEAKRLEKKPTDDLAAYDFYLKGRELLLKGSPENLEAAIPFFKKAIERDQGFALAYAEAAITYYYMDLFQANKIHSDELANFADQALLHDPRLVESLVAKALSYEVKKQYDLALPVLEKALEYNPNSVMVINMLSEFYNIHLPNTGKYLEYSLAAARLDIASHDSSTISYIYLNLANSFLQTGFFDEAETYINRSLAYNPNNPFSGYLKPFVLFAKDRDLKKARDLVKKELEKDTTRIDILAQVANASYILRDFNDANKCYKQLFNMRNKRHLDLFASEDLKAAFVMKYMGDKSKALELANSYKNFADADKTVYRFLFRSVYFAYVDDTRQSLAQLELFSKENNYQYWVVFLAADPVVDKIKNLPEFKRLVNVITDKFWHEHADIKARLTNKGLLDVARSKD